jgi:hypothetical protein
MKTAAPSTGTHAGHHPTAPGSVFPGQPPAHVLPTPVGPGTTQPPDIPDTAKRSPLPHWDGVLVGWSLASGAGIYVNGAFNYGDFGSVDQALTAVSQLTAPADKPAAVVWKDKFGIVHAQALLTLNQSGSPVAFHVSDASATLLGHPEALFIVDGDATIQTSVPSTVPVPANGGTGWKPGGTP